MCTNRVTWHVYSRCSKIRTRTSNAFDLLHPMKSEAQISHDFTCPRKTTIETNNIIEPLPPEKAYRISTMKLQSLCCSSNFTWRVFFVCFFLLWFFCFEKEAKTSKPCKESIPVTAEKKIWHENEVIWAKTRWRQLIYRA